MKYILRYAFLKFGNLLRKFNTFFLRKSGIKIGENCFISLNAKFDLTRGNIIVGNNCTITYGCCLISHDPMERRINPKKNGEGTIIIEDNVYLGINTIVLKDVTIGHHAIVGAGSVIIKNIPPFAVVVGNPGKILKYLNEMTCPHCDSPLPDKAVKYMNTGTPIDCPNCKKVIPGAPQATKDVKKKPKK